jgi:hypothetical protein
MAQKKATDPGGGGGTSFRKPPPELLEAFEKALPAEAQRRAVFGFPAGFVNGNMFTHLFQESFVVRLPDEGREELLREPGALPFEPMPGRPMREYVVLPQKVAVKPEAAGPWVRRAFDYAAALPPKAAKKAAAKKAAGAKKKASGSKGK